MSSGFGRACVSMVSLVIACSSARGTSVTVDKGAGPRGTNGDVGTADDAACAPGLVAVHRYGRLFEHERLGSFAEDCPANWTAAKADHPTFCANRPMSEFNASLSDDACRGWLRYTKFLFDGGPRYCLYDPKTLELAGYAASDGKAMYEAGSCGFDRAAFEGNGCAATSCPPFRAKGAANPHDLDPSERAAGAGL